MPQFSSSQQRAIDSLARDLDGILGPRLVSLVAFPGHQGDGSVHSCALVQDLTYRDLTSCLPLTESWHHRGTSVPLLLSPEELRRTVDIFPLEYTTMLADYALVRGRDPFAGLTIPAEDVRRAVEGLAKSHLIHLREAFLESHGETMRIAGLIAASAAPLRALLTHIARMPESAAAPAASGTPDDDALAAMAQRRMGVDSALIRTVLASSSRGHSTITDPSHLLGPYIDASKRIWEYVDGWRS
jgi:hypothetical protein